MTSLAWGRMLKMTRVGEVMVIGTWMWRRRQSRIAGSGGGLIRYLSVLE
jgi:hypothetical protein